MLTKSRSDKINQVVDQRQQGLIVVFEDIHDPHNASAVMRSCDAFGIQEVFFIFEQEKYYNPKKVGKYSSSSANKWLTVNTAKSTKQLLTKLKKQGYTLFATALDEKAKDIFKTNFTKYNKLAIIIGNEHRGLSQTALTMADFKLYIPMRGMVQSLNLSVTAGITLFEVTRQRQKSKKSFLLSPTQAKKLTKEFSQK
jgi:tRNA (guanosine-2'-O-)-methyltransferase